MVSKWLSFETTSSSAYPFIKVGKIDQLSLLNDFSKNPFRGAKNSDHLQYGPCILRLFKFAEFKTFIVLNWPEYYQMLMIDDPGKYLMLFGPLRP